MASQFSGIKAGEKRPVERTDNSAASGSRIAAKTADIKAFTDLMREKKRLSERTNEQHTGLSAAEQSQTTPSVSSPLTDVCSAVSQQLQHPVTEPPRTGSANAQHEQTLSLSLNSESTDGAQGKMSPKIIESVVSVVQRMIINHASSADPKKWDIQLGIDGLEVLEMSLSYLGKDEWRLDLIDDQSTKNHDSDNSEIASIHENIEQVIPDLQAALRKSRPALQLSVALIVRSNA